MTSVTPVHRILRVSIVPNDEMIARVHVAKQNGLFEPYINEIKQSNWTEVVTYPEKHPESLELAYLFTLAISRDPIEAISLEKLTLVEPLKTCPKQILVHILPILPEELRRGIVRQTGEAEQLLRAIIESHIPAQNRTPLLDCLFNTLSYYQALELVFYSLAEIKEDFSAIRSAELNERFQAVQEMITEYGQKVLLLVRKTPCTVSLPFSGTMSRHAFLMWFKQITMTQLEAACIATSFTSKEFALVADKLQVEAWLIQFLDAFQRGVLVDESGQRGFQSPIGCFIAKCLQHLETCDSNFSLEKFADCLSQQSLEYFYDAFPKGVQARLAEVCPAKFIAWAQMILTGPEWNYKTKLERLKELYQPLSALTIDDDVLLLSLYACLDEVDKEVLLKRLLQDPSCAYNRIKHWFELSQESQSKLLPDVRELVSLDLSDRLLKVDAEFAARFQQPTETRQERAIRLLERHFLTPGISANTRYKFCSSLKKDLQGTLSNQALFYFLAEKLPEQTLPYLLTYFGNLLCLRPYDEYLETHTEGGIFAEMDATNAPDANLAYNASQKEADRQLQNIEQKGKPAQPNDAHRAWMWENLAIFSQLTATRSTPEPRDPQKLREIGAKSLAQVAALNDAEDVRMGLQHLYQAACETRTIYTIVQNFRALVSPLQFVKTMAKFHQACFKNNLDGFIRLLKAALGNDTLQAASVLIIASQNLPPKIGQIDIDRCLWDDLIVKGKEQESALAKEIIKLQGDRFVELFVSAKEWHVWMISSLATIHPEFCKKLFYDSLQVIQFSQKEAHVKVRMLRNFCEAYHKSGVFKLRALLETVKIQNFYTKEIVQQEVAAIQFDWFLLSLIAEEFFDQALCYKIEQLAPKRQFKQLFDALCKLYSDDTFTFEFLDAHADAREHVIQALQANISDAISMGYFGYVKRYIPDWKSRLLAYVKEHLWMHNFIVRAFVIDLKNEGLYADWLHEVSLQLTRAERFSLCHIAE